MKRLILILPIVIFFAGCLYIKPDVGLTDYMYQKCDEYYDADGIYHKDCPQPFTKESRKLANDTYILLKETINDTKKDTTSQKRCFCKKSCYLKCIKNLSKKECISRCCYER